VECVIICDTAHVFEKTGAKTIIVSQGSDSVDFKLVNMIQKGDIVVTQDYGLAAMCMARGAVKGMDLLLEHCGFAGFEYDRKALDFTAVYKITLDSYTGKRRFI
jgi:hypothetical protein